MQHNSAIRLKLEEELKKLTQQNVNVSSTDYFYILSIKNQEIKIPKVINNNVTSKIITNK